MEDVNIRDILDRNHADRDGLIAALSEIQDECGYLPEQALRMVSKETGRPLIDLYGIAAFYNAFSLQPRGKHLIQVCMGTACHVKGAPAVLDAFCRELDIEPGGTTKDKQFTVEGVRCLGCCSLAPVVAVDDKYHGGVTVSQVSKIIKDAKRKGAN